MTVRLLTRKRKAKEEGKRGQVGFRAARPVHHTLRRGLDVCVGAAHCPKCSVVNRLTEHNALRAGLVQKWVTLGERRASVPGVSSTWLAHALVAPGGCPSVCATHGRKFISRRLLARNNSLRLASLTKYGLLRTAPRSLTLSARHVLPA